MRPRTLDHKIMTKLAKKLGKSSTAAINRLVYARGARQGISSEAALIQLAREHGIGTATYQGKLDPTKQAEARTNPPILPGSGIHRGGAPTKPGSKKNILSAKAMYKAAVASLIQDDELRERCADLLVANKHFDRAINQATLVLEDRIRHKALPLKELVGENLIGFAFNESSPRRSCKFQARTQLIKEALHRFCVVLSQRFVTRHITTSPQVSPERTRCAFADLLTFSCA